MKSKYLDKKHWWILVAILLVLDIVQTTIHYSNIPVDGDLIKVVTPIKEYKTVLNDPIGIKAIKNNLHYDGAARFSCHFATKLWFDYIPSVINLATKNPVNSVFYSSALFVLLIQILFIYLSVAYSRIKQCKPSLSVILLIALMSSAFIQLNSFYHNIGIIDRSITYVFFYIFPLLLFLIFLLPFYQYHNSFKKRKELNLVQHVLLAALGVFICFSGPLMQPVIIISFIIYSGALIISKSTLAIRTNRALFIHFCFLFILALYSFYISTFNSEADNSIALLDRYQLMFKGLLSILSGKLAWVLLLLGVCANILFIKKNGQFKQIRSVIFIVLVFISIYVLLLPMGGYRQYRPLIIRYDTFLPVTLCIIYLLVFTSTYCYKTLQKHRKYYLSGIIIFIILFANADINYNNSVGDCQKEVLTNISKNTSELIKISPECNILSWDNSEYGYNLELINCLNQCLRKWSIIKEEQQVEIN